MFHTTGPDHNDAVSFVHQSWPAEPRQLAPIRAEVRRWLASLGVGEDTETDMVLAVNEAVTNAVEHAANSASDTVELTFWTEETSHSLHRNRGSWEVAAPAAEDHRRLARHPDDEQPDRVDTDPLRRSRNPRTAAALAASGALGHVGEASCLRS